MSPKTLPNNLFRQRYGDRLRGLARLGRIPVLFRGDVNLLVLGPHVALVDQTIRPSDIPI
jgi:hypothetical protein